MRALLLSLSLLFGLPAKAAPPNVVTDIPVVQSLVSQVMGGLGSPVILVERGADPHHFQLKPSQARILSKADLLFWVGPEMTPWLERATEGLEFKGRSVALMEFSARHQDEENDSGDGDDHDHGADPHAWLDPENARRWARAISTALASADPGNAETYAANAAAAIERIDATEDTVRQILAPVGTTPFIVFHDGYGHFARAFGLQIAGSISDSHAKAPGAARLTALRATINDLGPICVFPEPQFDPAIVKSVTEGTKASLGAPLDAAGVSLPAGPELYSKLLISLAKNITDCVAGKH